MDYLIDTYAKQYDLKTPGGKARFVDAIMPTIRAVPNPVMRDGWLQRVRQAGWRSGCSSRSSAAGGRRPGGLAAIPAAVARRRITVDAVIAAADALPSPTASAASCPGNRSSCGCSSCPEMQGRITDSIGPDRLPNTVARELFRALVLAREPDEQGVHPAFSLTALVQALDPGRRPSPRRSSRGATRTRASWPAGAHLRVECLVIELEERALDEKSEFTQNALAEAEQAGDSELVGRLVRESQAINDQRRSLHRRRDQPSCTPVPPGGNPQCLSIRSTSSSSKPSSRARAAARPTSRRRSSPAPRQGRR